MRSRRWATVRRPRTGTSSRKWPASTRNPGRTVSGTKYAPMHRLLPQPPLPRVALFYIGTSSGLTFVNSAIQDSVKAGGKQFTFDIAPIPYKDKPVQNVYGASVSIPKTTKEQELAAWLFVRWYTEPEQQADWAKT